MKASGFEEGDLDVHIRVIRRGTDRTSREVCVVRKKVPAVAVATPITGAVSVAGVATAEIRGKGHAES